MVGLKPGQTQIPPDELHVRGHNLRCLEMHRERDPISEVWTRFPEPLDTTRDELEVRDAVIDDAALKLLDVLVHNGREVEGVVDVRVAIGEFRNLWQERYIRAGSIEVVLPQTDRYAVVSSCSGLRTGVDIERVVDPPVLVGVNSTWEGDLAAALNDLMRL